MKSSYDIIRRPIITEKATLASEVGGVVFEVAMKSNSFIFALLPIFNIR